MLDVPINLLLRTGVAFSFIYPPVSAFFNPYAWVGYFPGSVLDIAGSNDILLLHAFGILELVIGFWILSGIRIFIPSVMAAVLLAGIILVNLNQMDVLFRDVPILLMAVVLALVSYDEVGAREPTRAVSESGAG